MAELSVILASGDIGEIKKGGTTIEQEVVTVENVINQILSLRDSLRIELGSQVIRVNVNLGPSLSLSECQTHIPNPELYGRYLLIGDDYSFFVLWTGAVYLYERLSKAT